MRGKNVKTPWHGRDIQCLCLTEIQASFAALLKQKDILTALDEFRVLLWSVSNAENKSTQAGVLLAFKRKPMSVIWEINHPPSDALGRVVGARFEDCTVFGVYAKSLIESSQERIEFDQAFAAAVAVERRTRMDVYIVGDLNTPLYASELPSEQPWHKGPPYDFESERSNLKALLETCDLQCAATHHGYTWHWQPSATCPQKQKIGLRLDYILGPVREWYQSTPCMDSTGLTVITFPSALFSLTETSLAKNRSRNRKRLSSTRS